MSFLVAFRRSELIPQSFVIALCLAVSSSVVARASTMVFNVAAGTLTVHVDDPTVSVSLAGEELKITGAGQGEIRLNTGAYLFRSSLADRNLPPEVLSLRKDNRVVVRVEAASHDRADVRVAEPVVDTERLLSVAREKAGELVEARTSIDERVWPQVSSQYSSTEAAKLLIAFFRGNGHLPELNGELENAPQLQADLLQLRRLRVEAFHSLVQVARYEQRRGAAPLVGTWDVTHVSGAGGIAADALELYDPDPTGRKFVATNSSAALLTGAGFWLFDAAYHDDGPNSTRGSVDLNVVVRGDSVYHGIYSVNGDTAKLGLSPMNRPALTDLDQEPIDGGFVLTLQRSEPR